mmetsp:Transcript_12204/g.22078  ORF Transcript_12204/g.22078 Transcript_12204/m.22078 type:complete len:312 (-) Transcript_12204:257-1192(-)
MMINSAPRKHRILILYVVLFVIFVAQPQVNLDDASQAPQVWQQTSSSSSTSSNNTTNTINAIPKKISAIAYSLYGNREQFWGGAIPNVELAAGYFPDWQVRFYHDTTVPLKILTELRTLPNVKLYDMTNSSIVNPRAWRFLVAMDPEVTGAYILRDTDSRLTLREAKAVEEWLESNYTFHNMHDHPHHCSHTMQGGMWGGKAIIPEMRCVLDRCNTTKITTQQKVDKYDDQTMLAKFVVPIVMKDVMHHDSFCCWKDEICPSRSFPTKRDNVTRDHVGSQYLPNRQEQKSTAPLEDCHHNPKKQNLEGSYL